MVDLDALQTVAWERHNLDRRQMLFTDRLAREQDLTARLAALMRPVLEGHPLWQQLPAVQQGRVVRSNNATHEGGPLTAAHSLELLGQLYATP